MKPDFLKLGQPHRKWIPYFVLAIALLITALSTYYVATTVKAKDRLRFDSAVGETHDNIQNRLDIYITLLRATSGLFAAKGQVRSYEFRAFVNRLKLPQRYLGVQGIGFSALVMPQEKDALIAKMHKQGVENFSIRPDFKRSEYYPIIYLEPLDRRNQKAIGFDMFTESERRNAMERARDTGAPAASGKVTLIQETDKHKQAGFLIYIPVYRNGGIPDTVAERRSQLIGFVYSPFRAGDFMAGIFGNEKQQNVDFQIYDGKSLSWENLLHSSQGNISNSYQPEFRTTKTIDIGGRTWTIAFASRPEFETDSDTIFVPYIALGGLAISLLLFGVTRTQTRARIAAERSADELRSSQKALRESEERYRAFIEHSSEGIWCFELEQPLSKELSEDQQIEQFYQYGYLVECNHVMAQMYGFSQPAEIIGARLGDLLVQSEPLNIEYLRTFIRSGYNLNAAESYEVDKEGKPKYFLNNLVGIVENNVLLRAWGTQLDITQRKQIEAELRGSEARFRMLLENVQDYAIFLLDTNARVVRWSAGAEKILGYQEAEILGQSGSIIFTPEDLQQGADKEELNTASTEGQAEDERWHIRKDGSRFWASGIMTSLRDSSGQLQGFAKIMRDFSDRKQAEEEREQLLEREHSARAEAEAANRMKDEFLATLSHELRTPLNAMLGWTQLLRTRKFNEATTTKALETIDRNTRSLAQLIEDVLDVSRIITGKLSLKTRLVEVIPIIVAAIETVQPAAQAKGITLEFVNYPLVIGRSGEAQGDQNNYQLLFTNYQSPITNYQLPSDSQFMVLGDPNRLQQVFWNLLSNAVKFTPKGGRVEVRLDITASCVHIEVSDTGLGIKPEFLPYVFDRFRQADAGITREHGGLGLGLAIVRHLVELHGGNVCAKSQGVGQGATFIVELPIAAVSRLPTPEPQQKEQAQNLTLAPAPSPLTPTLANLKVLVVDDEPDSRELIATVLAQCGAEVTTVASAGEALEAVKKLQPDVLVSDIGMPHEDGYTLIRKLRADDGKLEKHIPAVALTAYASAEDRQKALLAGFQIHLAKPVDPSELIAVVGNLAGRNYLLGGENTR